MKKNVLAVLLMIIITSLGFAQEKQFDLGKSLSEIKEGTYKGPLLNNKLVEEFLNEYILTAEKYGMSLLPKIQGINFIFVEPESNIPKQLTEFNLGKVDFDKKLILLSRVCLLDSSILNATLFRELTHYFGVPYENEGVEMMSLNKPEGYSYAWLSDCSDNDIKQIEYDWLFTKLKKYVK
jgi:hypothetical protein